MTKRDAVKAKIEGILLSNPQKIFFSARGNEVVAEITREIAIELRAAIAAVAPVRQDIEVVRESDDCVVVLCRLRVDAEDWRDEVAELGEAWAVELGEKNAQQVRTRLYRTATTRAFKRAVEVLVGDLNNLLRGLAAMYAYRQSHGGGQLKPLPTVAAALVRLLGAGEISMQEFIQKLKQL